MSWDPYVMCRAQRELGNKAAGTERTVGLTAIDCSADGGWGSGEMSEEKFFKG
jgi:hypothetical protein